MILKTFSLGGRCEHAMASGARISADGCTEFVKNKCVETVWRLDLPGNPVGDGWLVHECVLFRLQPCFIMPNA